MWLTIGLVIGDVSLLSSVSSKLPDTSCLVRLEGILPPPS